MKPVRLSFDTQPAWRLALAGSGPPGWMGAAVLLLVCGAIALQAWQLAQVRQELSAVTDELQARGQMQRPRRLPQATVKPEQRQAWNQLVGQLNAPWGALLAGLEAATPDDVALVSIEPDARQSSVRVQAEAKSLQTLLAYADALKRTPPFADAVPLKHETNEQDPNRPVRLTLQLRLAAAAPQGPVEGAPR